MSTYSQELLIGKAVFLELFNFSWDNAGDIWNGTVEIYLRNRAEILFLCIMEVWNALEGLFGLNFY